MDVEFDVKRGNIDLGYFRTKYLKEYFAEKKRSRPNRWVKKIT